MSSIGAYFLTKKQPQKELALAKITQKVFMVNYVIHKHLAQQMDERLEWVRQQPQQIFLLGADGDESRQLLAARYPQARFAEYDARADALQAAQRIRQNGFFAKWFHKSITQTCATWHTPLPECQADMLWANLSLVWADDVVAVLENWASALKTHGMLFFTHFGQGSLREIRQILQDHQIHCAAPALLDMHDLGDMLFHHGFYDPVMDTANLVLRYESLTAFWDDMSVLGLWAALGLDDAEAARTVIEQAWQRGLWREITLETVFGHALKSLRLPENEQLVQFYPQKN